MRGNVGGTIQLLDTMMRQPRLPRLIFISSGGTVYGIPKQIPIPEGHPTEPLCAYGIGKLAIEKYLSLYQRLHGLDYRVLRLANPYGESAVLSFWSGGYLCLSCTKVSFPNRWRSGVTDSVVRDYLYIGDVIKAIQATMATKVQSGYST